MKITIKPSEYQNDTGIEFEEEAEFRRPLVGEHYVNRHGFVALAHKIVYDANYPVLTPKPPTGKEKIESAPIGSMIYVCGTPYFRHTQGITSCYGRTHALDNFYIDAFDSEDVQIRREDIQ